MLKKKLYGASLFFIFLAYSTEKPLLIVNPHTDIPPQGVLTIQKGHSVAFTRDVTVDRLGITAGTVVTFPHDMHLTPAILGTTLTQNTITAPQASAAPVSFMQGMMPGAAFAQAPLIPQQAPMRQPTAPGYYTPSMSPFEHSMQQTFIQAFPGMQGMTPGVALSQAPLSPQQAHIAQEPASGYHTPLMSPFGHPIQQAFTQHFPTMQGMMPEPTFDQAPLQPEQALMAQEPTSEYHTPFTPPFGYPMQEAFPAHFPTMQDMMPQPTFVQTPYDAQQVPVEQKPVSASPNKQRVSRALPIMAPNTLTTVATTTSSALSLLSAPLSAPACLMQDATTIASANAQTPSPMSNDSQQEKEKKTTDTQDNQEEISNTTFSIDSIPVALNQSINYPVAFGDQTTIDELLNQGPQIFVMGTGIDNKQTIYHKNSCWATSLSDPQYFKVTKTGTTISSTPLSQEETAQLNAQFTAARNVHFQNTVPATEETLTDTHVSHVQEENTNTATSLTAANNITTKAVGVEDDTADNNEAATDDRAQSSNETVYPQTEPSENNDDEENEPENNDKKPAAQKTPKKKNKKGKKREKQKQPSQNENALTQRPSPEDLITKVNTFAKGIKTRLKDIDAPTETFAQVVNTLFEQEGLQDLLINPQSYKISSITDRNKLKTYKQNFSLVLSLAVLAKKQSERTKFTKPLKEYLSEEQMEDIHDEDAFIDAQNAHELNKDIHYYLERNDFSDETERKELLKNIDFLTRCETSKPALADKNAWYVPQLKKFVTAFLKQKKSTLPPEQQLTSIRRFLAFVRNRTELLCLNADQIKQIETLAKPYFSNPELGEKLEEDLFEILREYAELIHRNPNDDKAWENLVQSDDPTSTNSWIFEDIPPHRREYFTQALIAMIGAPETFGAYDTENASYTSTKPFISRLKLLSEKDKTILAELLEKKASLRRSPILEDDLHLLWAHLICQPDSPQTESFITEITGKKDSYDYKATKKVFHTLRDKIKAIYSLALGLTAHSKFVYKKDLFTLIATLTETIMSSNPGVIPTTKTDLPYINALACACTGKNTQDLVNTIASTLQDRIKSKQSIALKKSEGSPTDFMNKILSNILTDISGMELSREQKFSILKQSLEAYIIQADDHSLAALLKRFINHQAENNALAFERDYPVTQLTEQNYRDEARESEYNFLMLCEYYRAHKKLPAGAQKDLLLEFLLPEGVNIDE